MRTTMKGGVWKNSEDEILKAAVMKYGLNNWSRVASLLVRKSAKQCKSRWYEWLDPSVKKTEWSRDEEEKLLHLSKLFPNQWRTIAPIVGRTAHQCLEHYDKLLDQAQGRNESDLLNDPRKLRPGEIDPAPETKPSRADAVDMDDDEREMLAEARARLANTRGKKAKRKAREKQLDEARRLASLQKKRELKAAGIAVGKWKRRRQDEIDYGREVPFETQPPKGFYAIGSEETPEVSRSMANYSLQQLEGRRRIDDEKRLRKEDARKLKRLMDEDLPKAMEIIEKINDPQTFRKRTKLTLPTPQLSDKDLDEIMKMGSESTSLSLTNDGAAHSRQLLSADEVRKPLLSAMTPMRTPMKEDIILLEAQNAVARTMAQTPLEGGENPHMHDVSLGTGATPMPMVIQTPNPLRLLRPGTDMTTMGGQTPAMYAQSVSGNSMISNAMAGTPLRDTLSLNEGIQGIKGIEAILKLQIKASLADLPEPVNEIEVAMPEEAEFDAGIDTKMEFPEDAEDIEKRKKLEEENRLKLEKKKQTLVIQQQLPRPLFPEKMKFCSSDYDAFKHKGAHFLALAEQMIFDEMEASALLETEIATLRDSNENGEELDLQESLELRKYWDNALESTLFDAEQQKFLADSEAPPQVRINTLKAEFDEVKQQLMKDSQKAKKLELKYSTLTKGYTTRAQTILKSIDTSWSELQTNSHNLKAYAKLEESEQSGLLVRKAALSDLVKREKNRHEKLQVAYATLMSQTQELQAY